MYVRWVVSMDGVFSRGDHGMEFRFGLRQHFCLIHTGVGPRLFGHVWWGIYR